MGIAAVAPLGLGDAHLFEDFDAQPPGLGPVHAPVQPKRLRHLPAHRDHRVQAGHRLLEDHRYAVAPDASQLPVGHPDQVPAAEHRRAGLHPAVLRQKPHDAQRGHALAAAGFPHQAHGDAAGDVDIHAVDGDRPVLPSVRSEGRDQVSDFKDVFHTHSQGSRFAPIASLQSRYRAIIAYFPVECYGFRNTILLRWLKCGDRLTRGNRKQGRGNRKSCCRAVATIPVPCSLGPAGPISLKTVQRTVFQALDVPNPPAPSHRWCARRPGRRCSRSPAPCRPQAGWRWDSPGPRSGRRPAARSPRRPRCRRARDRRS